MAAEADSARGTFLFAHGAGAGMDHQFMVDMCQMLESIGLSVVCFEFPYMQKRREDGKKRPPDRQPVLLDHYRAVIQAQKAKPGPLYIGGKSMGGRVASMLADEVEVAGVFVFGYPFHPPGKPENLRTAHLEHLVTPLHIFQGTRDAMGNREEVVHYALSPAVRLHWLEDGNHDLQPRRASGYTQQEHMQQIVRWIQEIIG